MQASRSFRQTIAALLSRPDEILLEAGAGGELLVARIRVVLATMLLLLPLANILAGGRLGETLIGLAAAVVVAAISLAWLKLARRPRRHRWLPFATAAFDVTATTVVLVALAQTHLPAGLNSMVVWCCYVLAIVFTALRGDGRTTLLAGSLALLQYGLLNVLVFASVTSPDQLVSMEYGAVTPANQIQRLLLLAMITVATAMVAYRMQRVVEMSGTDGLTRLHNRTWLLHRMPVLLAEADDTGSSLSIALIDLDNFKRINDESGHHAGDRALRHVVQVLQAMAEPGDWLVRLGGEEFVLVLEQPAGTAWERLDAMRRMLCERPFEHDRGAGGRSRLTFSAGIAASPHDGRDLSRLLRRANERLRIAKNEGGNKVIARDG